MKDMSVKQAEMVVSSLASSGDVTLDEIEDYGFTVLKAVAVIRRELHEKEQTLG